MKTKISIPVLGLILSALFWMSSDINAQSDYVVNGSASSVGEDCFILTPDEGDQAGSVWYHHYILLGYDFEMTFQLNYGPKDNIGADGMAFVIQPNNTALGNAGSGMGYEGILPSIAVEYDTWMNFDPEYDHIAVHKNRTGVWDSPVAGPVPASATSENIEDGEWHSTRIIWDASNFTLSIYFDEVLRLTYTEDIVTTVFSGNPAVYWGFTAATGAFCNLQQFCATSLTFTEFGVNVSKTNASCNGADDGTATVTSIIGGTPPYTFNGWYNGSDLISMNTSLAGLAPGAYTAYYTDAASVTLNKTVNITEPAAVSFTHDVDNECSGNITFTASGGTPPYAYSDDGGSTFQASNVFINEPQGNYNLMIKDAHDCLSPVSIATVNITDPLVLTGVPSPATSGCNGSIMLTPSGGTSPYSWDRFFYPFNGTSVNTALFTVYNGNFTENGGSLRGDNDINLWTDMFNSIFTNAVYPRTAGDVFESSFKFDDFSAVWFGWTKGEFMYSDFDIAYGCWIDMEWSQNIYTIGYGGNWTDVGDVVPGEWYDFKIKLTETGADYYFRLATSPDYTFLFSASSNLNSPNMGIGAGYYIVLDYYNGFNTKNWRIGHDTVTSDLCPGVYKYTVFDAAGCSAAASVTITEGCSGELTVNAGEDATTYFGITSMQSVTRTAVVSGGTAPFTFNWTLGRPLLCNQVNDDGDESFVGGTCAENTCPESGSPTENATCSGNATITAVLLDTTSICVTVTDANGCTATDCFTVNASDVRCFSGNGGGNKVKMCHHTNSNGNPWVEVCVDTNAIESHLAHGDYIGVCDNNKSSELEVAAETDLHFRLFPNPATNRVTIEFESSTENSYIIELNDMLGRKLSGYQGKALLGENTREINLAGIQRGIYLVNLVLDGKYNVKKLVIE